MLGKLGDKEFSGLETNSLVEISWSLPGKSDQEKYICHTLLRTRFWFDSGIGSNPPSTGSHCRSWTAPWLSLPAGPRCPGTHPHVSKPSRVWEPIELVELFVFFTLNALLNGPFCGQKEIHISCTWFPYLWVPFNLATDLFGFPCDENQYFEIIKKTSFSLKSSVFFVKTLQKKSQHRLHKVGTLWTHYFTMSWFSCSALMNDLIS